MGSFSSHVSACVFIRLNSDQTVSGFMIFLEGIRLFLTNSFLCSLVSKKAELSFVSVSILSVCFSVAFCDLTYDFVSFVFSN